MSDIVERLRDKWQHSEEDCYEAADEIERLRTALEGAHSWLDRWATHVGSCYQSGAECTCGLTAIKYDISAALAQSQEEKGDE